MGFEIYCLIISPETILYSRVKIRVTCETWHCPNVSENSQKECLKLFARFGTICTILKKPATLLKITLLHGCFSRFLNCTNGTKSYKASYLECRWSSSSFKRIEYYNEIALPPFYNTSNPFNLTCKKATLNINR